MAYLLSDEKTLETENRPLRAIGDNYPRMIVSMDSHFRQDHEGIRWMNIKEFVRTFAL